LYKKYLFDELGITKVSLSALKCGAVELLNILPAKIFLTKVLNATESLTKLKSDEKKNKKINLLNTSYFSLLAHSLIFVEYRLL
jgi:hypothetical protein